MPDLIVHGGVITLSIRVENKTADEFKELEELLRSMKKLTLKDARTIAKIIHQGYVTQCGYETEDRNAKIAVKDYELVVTQIPNRRIS